MWKKLHERRNIVLMRNAFFSLKEGACSTMVRYEIRKLRTRKKKRRRERERERGREGGREGERYGTAALNGE